MGICMSKLLGRLRSTKEIRILMVGLDDAGKTTILYRMKGNTNKEVLPTIGFNVDKIKWKNVVFHMWDIGGQESVRPLWSHYFRGTQGLVFVVDSSRADRMEEAQEEFHKIVNDKHMAHAVVLIMCNKKDIEGALSPEEVTDRMALHKMKNRDWQIQASNALNGEGLNDGLNWLSATIKTKSDQQN